MPNKEFIKKTTLNVIELLEKEAISKMPVSITDQLIIDSIPYAICWRNIDGKIIGCNTSFAKLMKSKTDKCINKYLKDLLSEEEVGQLEEISQNVIAKNESQYFYIELDCDGKFETYETNDSPIHENGNIIGTVLTMTKRIKPTEGQKQKILESIDKLHTHIQEFKNKQNK